MTTPHQVHIANSDAEIAACFPVMRELRQHLDGDSFVKLIRRLTSEGYRLAYIAENECPVAVAGFRMGENLPWGKYLYVADLVTRSDSRSRGFGASLLQWLREYAISRDCDELHLDSGVQRTDAHRFYTSHGMELTSFHFRSRLDSSSK